MMPRGARWAVRRLVVAAVGIVLLIIPWGAFPVLLKTFVIVIVSVAVTLGAMRYLTPGET